MLHGTTSFVDEGSGTYHSRAVVVGGSAVKVAAETLVEQVRALAARRAGVDPAELLWQDGAIGAAVQGLGGAFLERLVYDEAGQLMTGTLADYALPTAEAFPSIDAITLEEAPSRLNPLGAKGAGEGGIVAVGAAAANAVAAALAPLGVVIRDLPLSPPALAALLHGARGAG